MRSCSAFLIALAILSLSGNVYARAPIVVLGGAASSRYLFTGAREQSIFYEGAANDVRFEVGGILALGATSRTSNLRLGLFAGGVLAMLSDEFRKPKARLEVEYHWFVTPHLTLNASMTGEMEPITLGSISAIRSVGMSSAASLAGLPTLSLQPALDAELELNRQHQLVGTLGVDSFVLLTGLMSGDYQVEYDDVVEAMGIYMELGYQRTLDRTHALRGLAVGRVMRASTPRYDPLTVLVGAQVGYTYRLRASLTVNARAGLGRVLNMPADYLLPVEPLASVEAAWTRRLDRFSAGANIGISEYVYLAGLPMRVIRGFVRYERAPSWRRLRGTAELAYEHNHFALGTTTIVDNSQQTLGLIGRLYFSLTKNWRLVGETAARIAFIGEGQPERGYYVSALAGVAYLHMERPRHERLLGTIW